MSDLGVHVAHCCRLHGCKYGDDDCPVATGVAEQSNPCEECGLSGIDELDTLQVVLAGQSVCCNCGQVLDKFSGLSEAELINISIGIGAADHESLLDEKVASGFLQELDAEIKRRKGSCYKPRGNFTRGMSVPRGPVPPVRSSRKNGMSQHFKSPYAIVVVRETSEDLPQPHDIPKVRVVFLNESEHAKLQEQLVSARGKLTENEDQADYHLDLVPIEQPGNHDDAAEFLASLTPSEEFEDL